MNVHPLRVAVAFAAALSLAAPVPAALAHPQPIPKTADEAAVEKEVLAFRGGVLDAIKVKDVARLKAAYDEHYTHTHGSGKVDGRDARIVALLAGEPVIETAPPSEMVVRVFGRDTAIVTGRSPVLNKAENRDYDFRWVVVYVRGKDGWRAAVSQATRLPLTK
ncbi:MAG: nuclear transport factor 2 family protein [Rhodospirillales bacterium]|nr:MAG: nuclear transport factor 2 family protein [Rhodospirillales bacterium]